ncbi:NapC/NirT family cytochrome c [candidate division KSB1 bacterium]|nr:NapC/NirT family cytochrome c [candidate division KSB1 bacterium]
MINKYKNFIRGLSVNNIGKTGVIIVTTVFITFLIFEVAHTLGLIRNAYLGLITYLAFPLLFVVGLILIPIGWRIYQKEQGKSTRELLNEQFEASDIQTKFAGSRLFRTIVALTVLNVIILSIAGARMLHFMDSAYFCGTACHTVMNPEWVTYQQSPHARVPCIECHVGEGVDALIASKLNGVRQMYLAAFNLYHRPIPTPVHTLRPARETCEHCHWPEKFYGQRLQRHVRYAMDSLSTPCYTTLNIKIDAGGPGRENGAHWHVSQTNQVAYTSVDDKRERLVLLKARQADGSIKTYFNKSLLEFEKAAKGEDERIMDCVDCHNRATHIYRDAEDIVDEFIRRGELDRGLPFLKEQALAALTAGYRSPEAAQNGIRNQIVNFYQQHYPSVAIEKSRELDRVVEILQNTHATNRHYHMRIEWGTYPSHVGHKKKLGCFRCHNADFKSENGEVIKHNCTMCHSILALDSAEPYQFLEQAKEDAPDRPMHEYLQKEFLESIFSE